MARGQRAQISARAIQTGNRRNGKIRAGKQRPTGFTGKTQVTAAKSNGIMQTQSIGGQVTGAGRDTWKQAAARGWQRLPSGVWVQAPGEWVRGAAVLPVGDWPDGKPSKPGKAKGRGTAGRVVTSGGSVFHRGTGERPQFGRAAAGAGGGWADRTDPARVRTARLHAAADVDKGARAMGAARQGAARRRAWLQDDGPLILELAGGPGWGGNQPAARGRLCSSPALGGAAASVGRRFERTSGVRPSQTTLDEAAAAGAAAAAAWLGRVRELVARYWVGSYRSRRAVAWCIAWDNGSDRAARTLYRIAWRAAFRSVDADRRGGYSGRHGAAHPGIWATSSLDEVSAELDEVSLAAWDGGAGSRVEPDKRFARRLAVAWFGRILTGKGSRQRLSLLAWLVCGADFGRAARGAGFASHASAVESMRSGKVWEQLAASCGESQAHLRLVRRAKVASGQAAAATAAMRLASGAFGALQAAAGAGANFLCGPMLRAARWTNAGAVSGVSSVSRVVVMGEPSSGLTVRRRRVWRGPAAAGLDLGAVERQWAAAEFASFAAARVGADKAERAAAFRRAKDGLRRHR